MLTPMTAPALRRVLLGAALAVGGTLAAGRAAAGVDPAATTAHTEHELLEDLGRRGLGSLLAAWAADAPALGDPATAGVLAAAEAKAAEVNADAAARAAAAAGDGAELSRQAALAAEAHERRLAALRTLAQGPALVNHPERADFAADLAEALLVDGLERRQRHADLFAAYGRPMAGGNALARTLAEALAAGQEAVRAAGTLRNRFGRDRAAEDAARASGLYDAVLLRAARRRAPLAIATSALGLATLLQGDPFFEDASPVPLAGALEDGPAERARLLDLAQQSARLLIEDAPAPASLAARVVLARAAVAGGDPAAATSSLRDLGPELSGGRLAIEAQLTLAAAADASGNPSVAKQALGAAADAATATGDAMLSLLVADAISRRAAAAGDTSAAAAAYAALPAALGPMVRARQASLAGSAAGGGDPAQLPPLVAAAVAREALAAGDAERARAAASAALRGLGDPAGLPEGPERAAAIAATVDLAAATAAASPGDPAATDAALAGLLSIARGFPRSPEAEPAMARAADLAAAAQAAVNLAEGPVADRYAETMGLLYDRFPYTPAADRHRLYWAHAGHVLRGDFAGAAEVYESVSPADPGRLDALALALHAREQAAAALGPGAAQQAQWLAAQGAAGRLAEEARARAAAEPLAGVLGVGRAALALARVEIARGNPLAGAASLDGLEARLGSASADPAAAPTTQGLLAEASGLRVSAFLAAGEADQAAAEAAAMLEQHPAAAAGVARSVLAEVSGRADDLLAQARGASPRRAAELEAQAASVSASAVTLARRLLANARARGLSGAELMPWQLALVTGLTRSGDADEALEFLRETRLVEDRPSDASVLEAAVEAHFAFAVERIRDAGGATTGYVLRDRPTADAVAREAAPLCDRLIRGLSSTRPPAFWNAWARRLAINLALGEGVDGVALSVARLEDTDPALGGPASAARLRSIRAAASGGVPPSAG